jgi:mRNA-degrading endonuclease RelE of RelBE toxin-antitoxin system
MDLVSTFLRKLHRKKRQEIEALLFQIKRKEFTHLDIKKLKGADNLFRVRKGSLRIIFSVRKGGTPKDPEVSIVSIHFRSDTTYR